MTRVVMVRDLALERWKSMDRYSSAITAQLPHAVVPESWRTTTGPRYWARYVRYPRALRGEAADLVHILDHSYAHCLASFPRVPSVVSVHDLMPLRTLAEGGRGFKALIRDGLLRRVLAWLRRADRLITSTAYTARELERYLDVPADRIRVVPYGIEPHFFARPGDDVLGRRRAAWAARMPQPVEVVLLHVGGCQPRKNVETAIGALGLLRARGLRAMLVQLGGHFEASHYAAMRSAGVEAWVVQESPVAEDDLVAAYYAADALVFPSTFEGWGMPVVEAMAAGLPVLTSGAGGLREAAGEAALVVGALNPDAWADALGRLLGDPAARAHLTARGVSRARALSWESTGAATRAVHDELISRT